VFAVLSWTEARIFRRGVSTRMSVIRGELPDAGWFEVAVHATDITIIGPRTPSTRVTALLLEELDPRLIYFTWDDAAQELEDIIRSCQDRIEAGELCGETELDDLVRRLQKLELSRDEWHTLRHSLARVQIANERLRAEQATRSGTPRPA
jgi:hypothetical protein